MLIARQLTGSNSNTRPQAQLKLEKRFRSAMWQQVKIKRSLFYSSAVKQLQTD